jgi:DNA polymerase III alpha subunit
MITNLYGQPVYSEDDLFDLYMRDPSKSLKRTLVSSAIKFNEELELENIPDLVDHVVLQLSVDDFDKITQNNWFMPKKYREFDIAKFVLDQCTCDAELQRAGKELLMYDQRGMLTLLQYMKYLVDVMRKHNIVWGVGRGSSVASFVLFLIGIHRINSLYYDLDIEEFLK